MSRKKAFFVSFGISMVLVLTAYGLIYYSFDRGARETDTPQKGVPVAAPQPEDSKTLLLCVGDEQHYFFLFKFNALQNKIGIGAISPSFQFSDGDSMEDSLRSAGIMQCVLDIEQEFGIKADYYLHCTWTQLGRLTEDLTEFGIEELGQGLPQGIRNYLLQGAEKLDGKSLAGAAQKAEGLLDNELGLAFMTEAAWCMIKYNLEQLPQVCGTTLKDSYSRLITNMNTTRLNRMERIIKFLSVSHLEYPREVILKDDERRREKLERITG